MYSLVRSARCGYQSESRVGGSLSDQNCSPEYVTVGQTDVRASDAAITDAIELAYPFQSELTSQVSGQIDVLSATFQYMRSMSTKPEMWWL
jgi:hypothetical protein